MRYALDGALSELPERHAETLRNWLGMDAPPKILEDIGASLGVTRERARQLRNSAWERIRKRYRWPHDVIPRVDGLLNGRAEPLYLDLIAVDDQWFDGFQENLAPLGRLIEDCADDSLHVWPLNGRMVVAHCSADGWADLADTARLAIEREISRGVTRSDARVLIEGVATAAAAAELAEPLWERLAPTLHFALGHNGEECLVSIGRGLRHALAAILSESERPLHMREIIEQLCERGYVRKNDYATQNMVRTAIREAGGVLYGRSVYGLAKHLPISAEFVEDVLAELEAIVLTAAPGRQWHCSELADALAGRGLDYGEDLDAYSVNVILGGAANLTYLGRLVWVSAGRTEALQNRLDVAAMCEAVLLEAGRPLTKRELRDAIRRVRGLNQNFLPQTSERVVRLAHGMWGLADRDVGVSAAGQQAALDALYRTLDERQKGLHLSELVGALEASDFTLDPELDQSELLGIAQSDSRFRVGRGQYVGLAAWTDVRRRSVAQAFAEIQARWTGPVNGDNLFDAVCSLIERKMPRTSFASQAPRAGFIYDSKTGLWDLADTASDSEMDPDDEE